MRERGLGFRGGMSEDLCGHGKKARWRKDVWRGVSAFMCAFLLFAVFVVPAASHEKLASEDYNTLKIYGNANEDDTVDMRDVTYIKLVIFGKKPETEFCDANYDGRVSMLDVVQTKLIIVGKEAKLTIVDSADRTVTVKKPVERIVPQPITLYEPIWVLGAQDKVVGVRTEAKEDDYPWLPRIQDIPAIGRRKELDYEKIIELKPDIVIASKKAVEEMEEKLAPAGITVVALQLVEIEKFDPEFKILAKILGKDERAEEFISWRQKHLEMVKERTEGIESKVKVFGEYTDVEWGTGGKGSGLHSVITAAGGYNIAGDEVGYFGIVDPEWVIRENPKVILLVEWTGLTGYYIDSYEGVKQLIENAYNRTGLKETYAVKNGRVYVIDGPGVLTACRNNIAVLYCAKWFYPEQFEDLNPEEIHREYFEEWIGVEYKGVWAYPLIGG